MERRARRVHATLACSGLCADAQAHRRTHATRVRWERAMQPRRRILASAPDILAWYRGVRGKRSFHDACVGWASVRQHALTAGRLVLPWGCTTQGAATLPCA